MEEDAHRLALLAAVDAVLAGHDPAVAEGSALDTLCACFGLTSFERKVLLLAAAAELRPSQGEVPTFAYALSTFADAHWSALTPVAPLRRWQLVDVDPGAVLTTARLRIDERVLHFLVGVPYVDSRLQGLVRRVDVPDDLPASQQRSAESAALEWTTTSAVQIAGADQRTRWEVAATAARRIGVTLYAMSADDVPAGAAERSVLARLWEREALLLPAALIVEGAAKSFVDLIGTPVVVSLLDPSADWPRVLVSRPTQDEQRRLWHTALDGTVDDERLGDLVAQFSLPSHVIRTAGASVLRSSGDAWQAGLAHARMALDELGQRIEPRAVGGDLVLPDAQRAILGEIGAHVRHRSRVYQEWGFEQVLRRGLGVTALFAGGSGTGKTLAAEVLAGELGLDLFVIDLSQVISKYIGETEKNLRKVFDAAEGGGALLLFDEADALFGKRSEIKDSHDRYANIEVSYLLMRMESYRGLAILTTNMKKALDTAFLRRIRFVVDFPFPGPAERAEIWRRVIPADTPVLDLDPVRLAQLSVPGGSIRNVALSAAFLAAEESSPLAMRHVLAAARTEYLKLERSLTTAEVAGWS